LKIKPNPRFIQRHAQLISKRTIEKHRTINCRRYKKSAMQEGSWMITDRSTTFAAAAQNTTKKGLPKKLGRLYSMRLRVKPPN
jgi:hypothetical protein